MTPTAEKILNANVVEIEYFQSSADQWTTNLRLEGGQAFRVVADQKGYLFVPVKENSQLPELKQVFWKRYKMGFGGRGCGYDTEVKLADGVSEADKAAYTKILEPAEIDEGRWVPYPRYKFLPMLSTAFKITRAHNQQKKIAQVMKMADQNMADVLALRKQTYDLRQYE